MEELSRVFRNSLTFYQERLKLIVFFSIPFLLAFAALSLVSAPTYQALGGLFSRTGSIPELSTTDIVIIALAYVLSFFVIADAVTNVNLVIRSQRTLTIASREVLAAMGKYAIRIFYIYTIMLLLIFIAQLVLYDNSFKGWLFPAFTFVLSFLMFFIAPAVVIDEEDTAGAIRKSASMSMRRPKFVLAWALIGLVVLSVPELIFDLILPHWLATFLVFVINSLFLLPFLLVLQTQMFMEKYPLAK
jgi:hypothetical protein